MKLFDLSHAFTPDIPVYPGEPAPQIKQMANLKEHGYICYELTATMHIGTHIDAPLHFYENGKRLCDFPPEKFIGRALLIDVRGKQTIDADVLQHTGIQKDDMVFLFTDHAKKFRQPDYYQSWPGVTENFGHELVRLGIKILGIDAPSIDHPPFPVHQIILKEDILIIENLTNLESLLQYKTFQAMAIPPKYALDGAHLRVIAKI